MVSTHPTRSCNCGSVAWLAATTPSTSSCLDLPGRTFWWLATVTFSMLSCPELLPQISLCSAPLLHHVQGSGRQQRMTCVMCVQELLRRVSTWLRRGGRLFVHIFCHKRFAYHFTVRGHSAAQLAAVPVVLPGGTWASASSSQHAAKQLPDRSNSTQHCFPCAMKACRLLAEVSRSSNSSTNILMPSWLVASRRMPLASCHDGTRFLVKTQQQQQ